MEKGLLGDLDTYPSTGNPYDFVANIFITAVTALVSGLLIGTIEILYLSKLFTGSGFLRKVVYKTLIYIGIMITFLLLTTLISNSFRLDSNVFDPKVWNTVWIFFDNFAFWSVEVYIAAIIGVSLFYSEVSDNLGQGVLQNFLTGKYHTPTEEERIFMFLDMKSSTTIAEQLGHVKYFNLLKEYYADLSDPIIQHFGEIYQYVGDEIVVSWKSKDGLKNTNWLYCFHDMQKALIENSKKYKEAYGVVPSFKAGIHRGEVTTGEIGVIKKEIIFTGDVLNTTSRIQNLCNQYNVDIIFSQSMLNSGLNNKNIRPLGKTQLRGKDEELELFTLA